MREKIKNLLTELRLNEMLAVLDSELDQAEPDGEALETLHRLLTEEHRDRLERAMNWTGYTFLDSRIHTQ